MTPDLWPDGPLDLGDAEDADTDAERRKTILDAEE
jgi:hypothetical protein